MAALVDESASVGAEQQLHSTANISEANASYPLVVDYCGECSMPIEYCEYSPFPDKCKAWLQKNLPNRLAQINLGAPSEQGQKPDEANSEAAVEPADAEKKRQKRGGKGAPKAPKKAGVTAQKVQLSRAPRGKNKFVTVVTGLSSHDIDLKVASKFFAQKFACGSSVTGADEVVIQGDVKDDLLDLIPEKWPQIDEDAIDDLGDLKR